MLLRNLFEDLTRTGQDKSAVVGWGRGMGHKGHMFLASSVITQAKETSADPYFVVSRTVGKDDPITPEEKLAIYKKVFPQSGHIFQTATEEMPDLTRVLSKLQNMGYTDVTVVVGADQVNALGYVKNYNGKPDKAGNIPFSFNTLNVISRQETNDPSRDQEGPRATPMRAVLMDPAKSEEEKFAVWRDAMNPELSDEEVMDLMHKAEQRMKAMVKPKKKAAKEGLDNSWGDQGNFAGDTPVNIGGSFKRLKLEVGQKVKVNAGHYKGIGEIEEIKGDQARVWMDSYARSFVFDLTDLSPAFGKPVSEGTSLESTLRAVINDIGEPITSVYDAMKFQAKKYVDNHGELDRGFRMVAAGIGGRWVQNMYVGRLQNELYDLCKYNTRRTVELREFLRGVETDGELEMKRSFGNIANNLPTILARLGQHLNAPQLTKNANRWMQNKAAYEDYIANLEAEDDYEEPAAVKAPKSNVIGQQNVQVDQIVNNVLGKLPSKIQGDIRNAIARAPNKLQALQAELQKRGVKAPMEEATFKKSPYGRTAASQQRAKELLNPPKPPEPKKDEKDVEEARKKKSRSKNKLSKYFFPGYGYYGYGGSNDSGEGGGDGGGEGGGESAAEGVDIGQEWMSDTELDQYVPARLQQQWRELLGYDENGNPSALWANLTGGYEPDVNDPQHRALMVKVANKWFAAKKIPNVKFFDVKDADDELEWLVQIGEQGVAENYHSDLMKQTYAKFFKPAPPKTVLAVKKFLSDVIISLGTAQDNDYNDNDEEISWEQDLSDVREAYSKLRSNTSPNWFDIADAVLSYDTEFRESMLEWAEEELGSKLVDFLWDEVWEAKHKISKSDGSYNIDVDSGQEVTPHKSYDPEKDPPKTPRNIEWKVMINGEQKIKFGGVSNNQEAAMKVATNWARNHGYEREVQAGKIKVVQVQQGVAEARRNPEQNRKSGSGKYDLINYAEDNITDKDNWAVSMTMEPKLGVNPQAAVSEDTPKGIYFYPLRYFMQLADRDESLPWGDNMPYLQLFQYDRSGEMTQQTKVDPARLKQALLQYCPEEVIQQAIDEPEYDGTPYWFIYDCLSRLGKSDETNVIRWNKILRDLGFTSVYDPGKGWIAYNEPTQGVILDPRIIKQHKMFDNRNPTLQRRRYDIQGLADAIGWSSYYQRESQLQRIYNHPDEKKVMLDVAKTMLKQFLGKNDKEAKALGYDQAIKAAADKVIEILKQDQQSVAEGWSQKYKSSINCNNPKGFSQKAHCAGKNEGVAVEPDPTGYQKDLLTSPENSLVIDTPSDLDWYKLGQHYPTLGTDDPHEYGQGDSDTVIVPYSKQELALLKQKLDRLQMRYKDIGGSHEQPEIHDKVEEKMLPKSAFAGSDKNKLGSAGQWKNTGPSKNRPARAGDLVGGDSVQNNDTPIEEKIKGVDGKACWPGKRYAGRVKKADGTYKDKCIPVSENIQNAMDVLINKIIVNEAIQNNKR